VKSALSLSTQKNVTGYEIVGCVPVILQVQGHSFSTMGHGHKSIVGKKKTQVTNVDNSELPGGVTADDFSPSVCPSSQLSQVPSVTDPIVN
jgi:hypothetical protein